MTTKTKRKATKKAAKRPGGSTPPKSSATPSQVLKEVKALTSRKRKLKKILDDATASQKVARGNYRKTADELDLLCDDIADGQGRFF